MSQERFKPYTKLLIEVSSPIGLQRHSITKHSNDLSLAEIQALLDDLLMSSLYSQETPSQDSNEEGGLCDV